MQVATKKNLLKILAPLVIVAALILVRGSIPRHFSIILDDNWKVQVTKPSFFKAVGRSVCTLEFLANDGKAKRIVFAESSFHQPIIILPSTESNVFYCVYDFDIDWQLIKISPNEPFQSLNPVLKGVIKNSDCRIERIAGTTANLADWKFAADELDRMSQLQFRRRYLGLEIPLIPINEFTLKSPLAGALRRYGDQGTYGDEDRPAP